MRGQIQRLWPPSSLAVQQHPGSILSRSLTPSLCQQQEAQQRLRVPVTR
jgi:hypothetical protein